MAICRPFRHARRRATARPSTGCASRSRQTARAWSWKPGRTSGRSRSITTSLSGWIEAELYDGLVGEDPPPAAQLETRVTDLASGNALYDSELLRRIDARRFPTVRLDLRSCRRMGVGNCYGIDGDVTMHGVTRHLTGAVTATILESSRRPLNGASSIDRRMIIAGEHVLDIRHFNMAIPSRPMLKLYPDVRLHLRLEADAVT